MRRSGQLGWLRPDGKAQVTFEYRDGRPLRVHTVVVSAQHSPDIGLEELRGEIVARVIRPVLAEELFDPENCILHVNPTGRFVVGGPHGDTGLTGRKIIVDTYGGAAHHGGGAFSGKDPSKVDRSAAYAARWAAKNVVAAGLARRCEIALAYAIGVAQPVAIQVETFGTASVPEPELERVLREVFDFSPAGIIAALKLKTPIYRVTAAYGHFGREPRAERVNGHMLQYFPWERTDRVEDLRGALRV